MCPRSAQIDSHGHVKRDPVTGQVIADNPCGSLKVGEIKGSMSEEEFDQAIYDLVNFLEYIAEPVAEDRKALGVNVLLFIAVFFVFAYLLNREYWKGIH